MELLRVRDDFGTYVALVRPIRGGKARVTFITTTGLRAKTLKAPRTAPVDYKGQPYPLKRAVRQFKRIARQSGATKAAIRELNHA